MQYFSISFLIFVIASPLWNVQILELQYIFKNVFYEDLEKDNKILLHFTFFYINIQVHIYYT